jgi:radical SAM superfamily enzyme YgiQ (UPF0313 family)
MSTPLKIYLADLFHDYRPNHICLPLGIGFVGQHLVDNFGTDVSVQLFKSPEHLLEATREQQPDLVGFSNYSWNQEINAFVQSRIAAENPDTVIIEGGPHIRTDRDGITQHLRNKPLVNYYTMFEGEIPTASLVRQMLGKGRSFKQDECGSDIEGIAFLQNNELSYTHRTPHKDELQNISSPYLSGMLDQFLKHPHYLPLLETNRGCPFACTFCAWGVSALNKVKKFDTEQVKDEIRYVGERSESTIWYLTDANFGMLPRDVDIARTIRETHDKSPYVRYIFVNWAKNSSRYTTEIAHTLSGICDPLVAVQTTDPEVLKSIKRDNIKMSTITDLVSQFKSDGIATTTDVLAGLPGETLESHFQTLRDVFSIGFQFFNIGQIRMLPGSEMESEEDRERFQLKTKFRFIPGFMGIYDGEPVCEYEESIVASNSMTTEDMATLRMVHFLAWSMWNSNLAQPLLRYMFLEEGINPLDAISSIATQTSDPVVTDLIERYKSDARNEWFESAEDLIKSFKENSNRHLNEESLKLNLNYLAQILLDKSLAERMLHVIASKSSSPAARALVDFCIERVCFIEGRTRSKSVVVPDEVIAALTKVYPAVSAESGNLCEFTVTEKDFNALQYELDRFAFTTDPVRGLTLALQTCGTRMTYDFVFDADTETTGTGKFSSTFDYADQFNELQREE